MATYKLSILVNWYNQTDPDKKQVSLWITSKGNDVQSCLASAVNLANTTYPEQTKGNAWVSEYEFQNPMF